MATSKKAKRPHLGRGLESLLGPITQIADTINESSNIGLGPNFPPDKELRQSVRQIPINEIKPNPYQPRTTWNEEELAELADSIRRNGILQPILVRKAGAGYQVIAGERRLRAAELAECESIPALVRVAQDAEMLELALIENVHRTDLNPIERAAAYQHYLNQLGLTQAEAAERLGQDRSVVANYLRLLNLPEDIKQMLGDGSLTMGHARAILALPTDQLKRKLANRAMAGRLSVREVERLVRRHLQKPNGTEGGKKEKAVHIIDLENRLRDVLGTRVRIEAHKNGRRGRIIVEFYSLDEFDKLTEKMGLTTADTT